MPESRESIVVSPDRGIRLVLGRVLLDSGYRVGEAADGRAMLHLPRQAQSPYVVVLERNAPLGGWDLIPLSLRYFLMNVRDLAFPSVGLSHTWRVLVKDRDLMAQHAVVLLMEGDKTLNRKARSVIQGHDITVLTLPIDNRSLLQAVTAARAKIVSQSNRD